MATSSFLVILCRRREPIRGVSTFNVEKIWLPRGFLVILYSQHTCGASDKGIWGDKRSAQHIAPFGISPPSHGSRYVFWCAAKQKCWPVTSVLWVLWGGYFIKNILVTLGPRVHFTGVALAKVTWLCVRGLGGLPFYDFPLVCPRSKLTLKAYGPEKVWCERWWQGFFDIVSILPFVSDSQQEVFLVKTNGLRVFRPAGVRKWNAWLVS